MNQNQKSKITQTSKIKSSVILSISLLNLVIAGCTGESSSSTNGNVNNKTASLSIVTPTNYPSGTSIGNNISLPIQIINHGNATATNLSYQISDSGDNTHNIIIEGGGSGCATVVANSSCNLVVTVPAEAVSGAFEIIANENTDSTSQLAKNNHLQSVTKLLSRMVGLSNLPNSTDIGVQGISLDYPMTVVKNSDGSSQAMITTVVTSANAGNFNTIKLVGKEGVKLNAVVTQLTGSSGQTPFAVNSIATFVVKIPQGVDKFDFYLQLLNNNQIIDTQTQANSIQVKDSVGVLNMFPRYFYLNEDYQSQIITLYNSGIDTISNLNLQNQVAKPLILTNISCGSTLSAGGSCQYAISLDPTYQQTNSFISSVSYNDSHNIANTEELTVNYVKNGAMTINSDGQFKFADTTTQVESSQIVTIKNTGITPISNISFGGLPATFTYSTESDNSCKVDTILQPGTSCNIGINYHSSQAISLSHNQLMVNYNYTTAKGTTVTDFITKDVTNETVRGIEPGELQFNTNQIKFMANSGYSSRNVQVLLNNSYLQGEFTVNLQLQGDTHNCLSIAPKTCTLSSDKSTCEVQVTNSGCNNSELAQIVATAANHDNAAMSINVYLPIH